MKNITILALGAALLSNGVKAGFVRPEVTEGHGFQILERREERSAPREDQRPPHINLGVADNLGIIHRE